MAVSEGERIVFIGYRRSVSETGEPRPGGSRTVEILSMFLEKLGFSVWYDKRLSRLLEREQRVLWQQTIDEKIQEAGICLFLWTQGADGSQELVREIRHSEANKNDLLISIDGSSPEKEFYDGQILDFRDFDALEVAREMPLLISIIFKRCGLPSRWKNEKDLYDYCAPYSLGHYKFGNIQIPVSVLQGVPDETYRIDEVEINYRDAFFHEQADYPRLLKNNFDFFLDKALSAHRVEKHRINDNPLVRLDNFGCLPEGPNDEKGALVLDLSKTSYFNVWANHMALDVAVPGNNDLHSNTIRRLFCPAPAELDHSVLANNPGIESMLVSDAGQPLEHRSIIVRRRSQHVAGYRGWFQSSSSGHWHLAHQNDDGVPCPFVSAETEAKQEIDFDLDVSPADWSLFGLLMRHQGFGLSLFGFFESQKSAVELIEAGCRDKYEGRISAIPLNAEAIFEHIARNKWFPQSAVCLIYTGIYFLGIDQMRSAAHNAPPTSSEHFDWGDINAMSG